MGMADGIDREAAINREIEREAGRLASKEIAAAERRRADEWRRKLDLLAVRVAKCDHEHEAFDLVLALVDDDHLARAVRELRERILEDFREALEANEAFNDAAGEADLAVAARLYLQVTEGEEVDER